MPKRPPKKTAFECLAPRQKLFVAAWCDSRNATKAAIAAGYSEKSAHSQGHRLYKSAEIKKAINDYLAQKLASVSASLYETQMIAFSDIMAFLDYDKDTGCLNLKNPNLLPDGLTRVVKKIKTKTTRRYSQEVGQISDEETGKVYDGKVLETVVEVELHDKLKALDMLLRAAKAYENGSAVPKQATDVSNPFVEAIGKTAKADWESEVNKDDPADAD